jgi:3-methyladenine DNA glycosylase AlkD
MINLERSFLVKFTEVRKQLKAMGTAQNQKIYARHGVDKPMYGVSYANLNKLQKTIKTDHDLALKLWNTGNNDAQVLATKIADPAQLNKTTINKWVKELGNYQLADAFADLVAQSKHAQDRAEQWHKSKDEWVSRVGWALISRLAISENGLTNAYFEQYLKMIKSDIHKRKNRVRESMNWSLIAIGTRSATLEKKALSVAKAIGKVDVDHSQTSCKTPDAATYIKKTVAHKKAKKK